MRRLLISFALVTTAVAAMPAAAQHRGDDRGGVERNRGGPSRQAISQLVRDLNRAEAGIQRSVLRRHISPREAISRRREANQIRERLNHGLRGGLSGREFNALRVQVDPARAAPAARAG